MAKEPTKFVMTRKRADWVEGRKTTLRGTPMRVNEAAVNRAGEEAEEMVYKMHKDVSRQVKNLFKTTTAKNSIPDKPKEITVENSAMDASISSQSRILMNKLINKWQKSFNLFSVSFTDKMISTVDKQAMTDTQRAVEKLSGGVTIKTDSLSERTNDILIASTDESTSLIKTISSDYTTEVKEALMRSITSNSSSFTQLKESIDSMLMSKYTTYKNKAKNIALDQTRKAYAGLSTSRMRDAGLNEYIWRHAGGSQNPRSYHKYTLNGQTFKLSDPPIIDPKTGERGEPSTLIHCKCYKEPVITFD